MIESGYALKEYGSAIQEIDKSGDGSVNYNEFFGWMVAMGALNMEGTKPVKVM